MCLSNNLNSLRPVSFDDTIIYAGEHVHPDEGDRPGLVEHSLAYFNTVQVKGAGTQKKSTKRSFGWDHAPVVPPVKPKGNAMLLAVPAVPHSISAASLIAVSGYPNFMKDYKRAISPLNNTRRRADFTIGSDAAKSPGAIVVKDFDSGTYDVVISPAAKAIAAVIAQVDQAKRPELNPALYEQLDELYPEWTFLLFCFTEEEDSKAGCAALKYKPMRPDMLYAPGLDGHEGEILWSEVALNHTLILGSNLMEEGKGSPVKFTDAGFRQAHPHFHDQVIGRSFGNGKIRPMVPQGDFLASVYDVREGIFNCKREAPPGAPAAAKDKDFYLS